MQIKIFTILFLLLYVGVNARDNTINGALTLKTVVIDAGHGGHDPGALGKHVQEKAITLAVALKLGELIKKNLPQVKVIYTRSTDVFIELNKRAEIANKNDADLFISIHVNSNPNINASGVDTWVLGQYKTNENFQVAKEENKVILAESNYTSQYEGFDPNSAESYIIFNLMQNAFIGQSLEFATDVQLKVSDAKRKDRGVESAPFLVLWKTTMPSVLVETGFISNANDEELLMTEEGQLQMATIIFSAFKDYKNKVDSRSTVSIFEQPAEPSPIAQKEQPKSTQAKTSNDQPIESSKNPETVNQKTTETKPAFHEFPKAQTSEPMVKKEEPRTETLSKNKNETTDSKEISKEQNKPTQNAIVKEQTKPITIVTAKEPIKEQAKPATIVTTKELVKPTTNVTAKEPVKDQAKPLPVTSTKEPVKEQIKPKAEPIVKETPKSITPQITVPTKEIPKTIEKPITKEIPKTEIIKKEISQVASKPVSKEFPKVQTKTPEVKLTTNASTASSIPDNSIYFTVQVLSSVKRIRLDSSIFMNFKTVREMKIAGVYKYLIGNEQYYENIVLLKNKTREVFPDAFVVAFKNGVKIPITDAIEATKNQKKN